MPTNVRVPVILHDSSGATTGAAVDYVPALLGDNRALTVRTREEAMRSILGVVTENASVHWVGGSASILSTGQAQFSLLPVREGDVITNIVTVTSVAGSGQTLVKLGLYTPAGVQLAVTADVKADFALTAGIRTSALTAPYTCTATDEANGVYAMILGVGGTQPTMIRTGTSLATELVALPGKPRPAAQQAGLSDAPSPATFADAGIAVWFRCT